MLNKIRNILSFITGSVFLIYICYSIYHSRPRANRDVIKYAEEELTSKSSYQSLADYFEDKSSHNSIIFMENIKQSLRYNNLDTHKELLLREELEMQGYSEKYVISLMQNAQIFCLEINFNNYILFCTDIRGNNYSDVYYLYSYNDINNLKKVLKDYQIEHTLNIPKQKDGWIYMLDEHWGIMVNLSK
ncbi:hypothetical protein [Chondrinema litorale]|uniref:hypothetical protein n=1 Tax=Chondrinema litorale TaxID=2994555 RepID=UPI00254346B6|nr:hypothetical protein [Chondrinema litorale]UZR98656.1 hypothetical protein OQ292_32110 [Chondrinema litorale]